MLLVLLFFYSTNNWTYHSKSVSGVISHALFHLATQGTDSLVISCQDGNLEIFLKLAEPILTEKTTVRYFFDGEKPKSAQWGVPKKAIVTVPGELTREILSQMAKASTFNVRLDGRLVVFELAGFEEARRAMQSPCVLQ